MTGSKGFTCQDYAGGAIDDAAAHGAREGRHDDLVGEDFLHAHRRALCGAVIESAVTAILCRNLCEMARLRAVRLHILPGSRCIDVHED